MTAHRRQKYALLLENGAIGINGGWMTKRRARQMFERHNDIHRRMKREGSIVVMRRAVGIIRYKD